MSTLAQLSTLERAFEARWEQLTRDLDPAPPMPTPQVMFSLERNYTFDFAWVDKLIFVELHGGGFNKGRHNREYGMVEDFTKYNLAVSMGWRGVYATTSMISDDPQTVIDTVLALLAHPVLSHNAEHSMWTARIRNLKRLGDQISNNGIQVVRLQSNKFAVHTGSGDFAVGGGKVLEEAQRAVLDFILRSASEAATPINLSKVGHTRERACF